MKNGDLVITGEQKNDEKEYLHRGIASRTFTRSWILGEYVEVQSAEINDGILVVDLARKIPEALKPRMISIK